MIVVVHVPLDPCMVYLPTFSSFFMADVGKFTIHRSHGC